jgi:integrase
MAWIRMCSARPSAPLKRRRLRRLGVSGWRTGPRPRQPLLNRRRHGCWSRFFAEIGSRPIREVAAPELLAALRKIEARGHHESADRANQKYGQVVRYAIATGRAERDISADLRGALVPVVAKNHAAITDPAEIGALRAIDRYEGQPVTAAALKLAPLVFVRPGDLRGARWAEFDLDAGECRIPGERMKMGEQHFVPLARQAVVILRDLQALTGRGEYAFPSLLSATRPMSNNTVNTALRRLGYTKDQMTGHGFRDGRHAAQ